MSAGRDLKIVKNSPEDSALLVGLLQHAFTDSEFARAFLPNFSRYDFRKETGDIFEAIRRSIDEKGKIDNGFLGGLLGYERLAEFAILPNKMPDIDPYSALKELVTTRTRQAAIRALHDQDIDRAREILGRLDAPIVPAPSQPAADPPGEITDEFIEGFMDIMEKNSTKKFLGLKTSLSRLDEATSGLIGGETWAISAPTSGGKTQLACQMAHEVLLQYGSVAYVSLEMSVPRIAARLVGANLRLNPRKIIEGKSGVAPGRIRDALGFLGAQGLIVWDNVLELSNIEREVRNLRDRKGRLDLVVIDFMQNIAVKGVSSMMDRMATAAVRLQALARETKSCIVVLSQLSNDAVREKGQGVMNFRWGNELGHAADVAIELVPEKNGDVTLFTRKNRSGGKGFFTLVWTGGYSRFMEL